MSSKPRKQTDREELRRVSLEIARKLEAPWTRKRYLDPLPEQLRRLSPPVLVLRSAARNETEYRVLITATTGKRVPVSEVRNELRNLHRGLKRLGLTIEVTQLL